MRKNMHKLWAFGCVLALASACSGDDTVASASEGESDSSTTEDSSATATTTASGTATDSATSNSGSESNSATMGTTEDPSATATATDPTATATDTDPTDTNPTTGETDSTTGDTTGDTTGVTGSTTGDTDSTTGDTTGGVETPCEDGKLWTVDADWDMGTLNNVNHDDPNNDQLQVTLDGVSAPKPYMFIAQTSEGKVLKIGTPTGKQLARYPTTLLSDCPSCAEGAGKAYPSRVIVDFEGDMFIANRAFGGQGSLTKIGGENSSCVDKNNNGKIDTSNDANDDGLIDINDPAEYFGQADECIRWTIPIGVPNTYPRALTLDGQGNAWVGTYQDKKAYRVDLTMDPPEVVETITLPSSPYGFVHRGDYLYSSALGQPVMRVDLANNNQITTMSAPGNYGIAVDQNGIGIFGGSGLLRCDFDKGGACQQINIGGSMNGVAVDQYGQIWGSRSGVVYKFANDGTVLGSVSAPGSYGIAIGHDNDPRVISHNTAYRIEAGKEGAPPGNAIEYSTKHKNGTSPSNYTYSDFTGFGAQNISIKKGEWKAVYDSEDETSEWVSLLTNQEPEGNIPPGTFITYQVRAANTEADLANEPWVVVEGEVIDKFVGGRYAEVQARLLIEDEELNESPVLSDICLKKI